MDLFTRCRYAGRMEMTGPFPYSVDESLVVEAMRRHMIRRSLTGLMGKMFIAVFVLLALLIVTDIFLIGRLSDTAIIFVIAIPVALVVTHLWVTPQLARRQHRQSAALQAQTTIGWDDTTIHFTSQRGVVTLPMAELYRWDETESTILLYQTEMFFNLVPKAPLGNSAQGLIARIEAAGVRRN